MVRIYAALAVFLFFAPATGCLAQVNKQPGNTAEKKQKDQVIIHDFGNLQAPEVGRHSFVLKNDSPQTLHIKDVSTSCGCTVSEVKKKVLEAGEATTIDVSFKSFGYSGPTQQVVYVYTDRAENPILKYIIKANVIPVAVDRGKNSAAAEKEGR